MAHVTKNRDKLLNRVRRIRGQLHAVEKAIDADDGCAEILQTLVAGRGAMNSLIAELLEDHLRSHVVDFDKNPASKQSQGARELADIIRAYLK